MYRKVDIPPPKTNIEELLKELKTERVKISTLDPLGQKVFSHVQSLNVIQSIVFDTAYNTNENLLICAPTGAGKTNIALLAITKCLQNRCVGTVLQDKQFKVCIHLRRGFSEFGKVFRKQIKFLWVELRFFEFFRLIQYFLVSG